MKQRFKLRGRAIDPGDVIRIHRGEFWVYRRGLQCKDIPTLPILAFLRDLGGVWGTWFGDEYYNSVTRAMPDNTPECLALAKMGQLIARGLVDGCQCGCRGDYVLTELGFAVLHYAGVSGRAMRRPDALVHPIYCRAECAP